jgi:SAM-dependent methyltransferase
VADAHFEVPRLAELYDPLDPDRSDLDAYAALAAEFGARTVLDIGCGTGTFACLLAGRGLEVIAADPAAASLEVARRKHGAGRVRWVHTDATALPPVQADLVTMTGNVAQVFVTGEEWVAVLRAVHGALRPGGRLAFESRDPGQKAWLGWNRGQTYRRTVNPGAGPVQTWVDLTKVEGNLVSFGTTFVFDRDGAVLTSESTLRFRSRGELADSLAEAGLVVDEVRDAPDRPGLELVFIARKAAQRPAQRQAGTPRPVVINRPAWRRLWFPPRARWTRRQGRSTAISRTCANTIRASCLRRFRTSRSSRVASGPGRSSGTS